MKTLLQLIFLGYASYGLSYTILSLFLTDTHAIPLAFLTALIFIL